MRRSRLFLLSNILTTFFDISLFSYIFFPVIAKLFFSDFQGALGGNIVMLIGAFVIAIGAVVSWVAFVMKHKKLCLVANIICNVGEVLSLGFIIFFIPSVVLGYIGYYRTFIRK